MPKIIEGKIVAKGMKFGIAASRFNDFICSRLIDGAIDALTRAGAEEKDIAIYKVPGSFELPLAAKKLAKSKRFDAVICLGAIIRGATPHFEYIASELAPCDIGLPDIETDVPDKRIMYAMDLCKEFSEKYDSSLR